MKELFKAFGIFCLMALLFSAFQMVALYCFPAWASSLTGLYVIQALSLVVVFGLSAVWGVWATEHINPMARMGVTRCVSGRNVLLVLLLAVAVQPLVSWTEQLNARIELPQFFALMELEADRMTHIFLDSHSVGRLLLNILIIAAVPAVCEELMFRGWIMRRLAGAMNPHIAVWVSAIIFSAVHMQFSGFVPRMLLGAALGYTYYYTRSLLASMLFHFVNNALAVVLNYLVFTGITEESEPHWWLATASAAVSVAVVFYLWKYNSESEKGRSSITA